MMKKPSKSPKKDGRKKESVSDHIFLSDSEKKNMADAFTCADIEYGSAQLRAIENAKTIDIKTMTNFLSEYLSNYILIGYDLNGDCYEIANPKTRKDADCLIEALRRTTNKIVGNGGFSVSEQDEQ
jgi:mannosyltransferase OCH1-like enzyme